MAYFENLINYFFFNKFSPENIKKFHKIISQFKEENNDEIYLKIWKKIDENQIHVEENTNSESDINNN